jgi:hypothetical protein
VHTLKLSPTEKNIRYLFLTTSHSTSLRPSRKRYGVPRASAWQAGQALLTHWFAAETSGNFAQQLVLLLPASFERPCEDLSKMVAVIHGSMKENNVGFSSVCRRDTIPLSPRLQRGKRGLQRFTSVLEMG